MLNTAYPILQSRAAVVKVMSADAYWLTATRESDGSDLPPFPTSVSAVREWYPVREWPGVKRQMMKGALFKWWVRWWLWKHTVL